MDNRSFKSCKQLLQLVDKLSRVVAETLFSDALMASIRVLTEFRVLCRLCDPSSQLVYLMPFFSPLLPNEDMNWISRYGSGPMGSLDQLMFSSWRCGRKRKEQLLKEPPKIQAALWGIINPSESRIGGQSPFVNPQHFDPKPKHTKPQTPEPYTEPRIPNPETTTDNAKSCLPQRGGG